MFLITEDPSSGEPCTVQNDSVVSVDMDRVGVMAAYCNPLCVCSSLYMKALKCLHIQ